MSGLSMDAVRVHYDSTRPADVGALAYTQGNEIHVAPGQERHLPHEAWHVVQQAQGRVAPTTQTAGGIGVNDSTHLEREADVMGRRAVARSPRSNGSIRQAVLPSSGEAPLQMVREDEFRADPAGFLGGNVLSLTMSDGMNARTEDKDIRAVHSDFLKALGSFDRHWFTLVPDVARSTEDRRAYILTPALEKYVQTWPKHPTLAKVLDKIGTALPVGADSAYISSAYVDYKNIGVTDDHEGTVGHADITTSKDSDADFNPDFVFTAAMNGCAFAFTPGEDDESFRAWHFQSTTANRGQAAKFRRQKNPTDWFGEDEYDSGEHAGLFEVTNLLHRGPDDSWSIISQQNETSATDMNDISTKAVTTRPLHLGVPDKVGMLKRIYGSLQKAKDDDIRRSAANTLTHQTQFPLHIQKSLQRLVVDIEKILGAEERLIAGADTLPALFAAANGVLQSRTQYAPNIRLATTAVVDGLERRITTERGRWKMLRNDALILSLGMAQSNLDSVADFLERTDWVTALIGESAPPAPAPVEDD